MGRFGRHLALKMMELKNEVMIVDIDKDKIDELLPSLRSANRGLHQKPFCAASA